MGIYVSLSNEARTSIAALNTLACAIFVILRVYHQKKYRTVVRQISWMGLSCMFTGFLVCFLLVNSASETYFGDEDRWCILSLKLNSGAYTLHRVLLYIFIILRLQVVSQYNIMYKRIIKRAKMVIGTTGTFMVVLMVVSTDGITDEDGRCTFQIVNFILIPLFAIDAIICFGGTYMFIRPLRRTLAQIECEEIANVLKKTMTWSLVSLGATLFTMLLIAVTDGAGVTVSFDCSITSFSLVMMMAPASPVEGPKSDQLEKNAIVEAQEITSVFKKKSSTTELANDILDTHSEEIQNEQNTSAV